MGMTRVRMFVVEPQPERVANVLRPVVSGDRRGEIVVIEKRRALSQQREIVLGQLAQHELRIFADGLDERQHVEGVGWAFVIQPLDRVISSYIAAAVKAADGNVRKAARQLQISPSTLYAKRV